MALQEIYVRSESETEARGPFNAEQLTSLVDAGQVTVDTLFYDATTEQWIPISANAEIKALLFPEKKKLTVRPKRQMEMLNKEKDDRPPVTVDDLLAAAEGRNTNMKSVEAVNLAMSRAAGIGRWAVILMLLIAAAGEILPSVDVVMTLDPMKILGTPLVIFGAIDLLLAVLLSLGEVSFYPMIRFRAALGLGCLGFIFWMQGQTTPMFLLFCGSAGLYLSTIFTSYLFVTIAALTGLGGLGFLVWGAIA